MVEVFFFGFVVVFDEGDDVDKVGVVSVYVPELNFDEVTDHLFGFV